ncbi:MAG: nucleotidyl transferase AbiEii/AbiGii toxin family protein [Pseudonocardiaceae bacterium]
MDQRHAELARIGLAAVGRYGFALAGGYALSAHGLIDRASEDVDLFTNRLEPDEFTGAVEAITEAYAQAGYAVDVVRRAELFARLLVGGDDPVRVELAYDWRGNRPALLGIGPVLDRDDAVAGKMLALWGRGDRPATTSTSTPLLLRSRGRVEADRSLRTRRAPGHDGDDDAAKL